MEEMEDRRACINCVNSEWVALEGHPNTEFRFRCKKLEKKMRAIEYLFDECQFFEKKDAEGNEEAVIQKAISEEAKSKQKKIMEFAQKKYMEAVKKKYIRDRLGWTLYETWKEFRK